MPAPLKLYNDRVTIELFVVETMKRLSVIYLSENKTIGLIKDHIRKNNEVNMLKTLVINKEQCINRIIRMYPEVDSPEWKHSDKATLKELSYKNKTQRKLYLKFVRAFAFLSDFR